MHIVTAYKMPMKILKCQLIISIPTNTTNCNGLYRAIQKHFEHYKLLYLVDFFSSIADLGPDAEALETTPHPPPNSRDYYWRCARLAGLRAARLLPQAIS